MLSHQKKASPSMATNALILSGGGARAAYQAGVLLALSEILPCLDNPFPIICGTSAGAINALAMAAHPVALINRRTISPKHGVSLR